MDFVITWVDGNDVAWQREKAKYSGKISGDDSVKRYREWDFLKYWFRGIEVNAPWVDAVYFVTYGHLPSWLNTDHPKLHVINHKDFIPEQYLPTFSCRPIELNLHRIPGLSENFVYFNDDMFMIQPVSETDFFCKGRPCDFAVLEASHLEGMDANHRALKPENYNTSTIMNMVPLNRNFDKQSSIRHNLWKWYNPLYGKLVLKTAACIPWKNFTGFKSQHMPYSLRKRTFEEVWEKEPYLLDRACSHRFRDSTDVSSRLFSYWQIAKGDFYPRPLTAGCYFGICDSENRINQIVDAIEKRKYKFICLNDEYSGDDFEGVKNRIILSFEKIFPKKSSFEKNN